jgi:hypothetical protein
MPDPDDRKKPAPKVEDSQVPPPPKSGDHQEWRIDEAEDESFPASDPSSETQPHPTKK